jgi:hypothetical protein
MSKRILGAGPLAVAALLTGVIGIAAAGGSPGAHSSVSFTPCDISGKQQDLGASYVTNLKVAGVSCTQGEKVIRAYHQCRHANGGAGGTCTGTVSGFTCKEGARQGVPDVQYNATVKCRKKSDAEKRVKSRYTQNV